MEATIALFLNVLDVHVHEHDLVSLIVDSRPQMSVLFNLYENI